MRLGEEIPALGANGFAALKHLFSNIKCKAR